MSAAQLGESFQILQLVPRESLSTLISLAISTTYAYRQATDCTH